ncbi:MAG: AraC family transcriptional regulator [Sulfitobacter sp.]
MSYEHIFNELEITTDPFALCELRGACKLGLGREPNATLHYVLSGKGEITIRGGTPVQVARGSIVLIPAMHSHVLRSFGDNFDPIPICRPAELDLARMLKTSDNASQGQLTALCTHVTIGLRGVKDIVDLVREPMVECVSPGSRMEQPLSRLVDEVSYPSLGSRAMIRAILLECMIEMLRLRLAAQDQALAWMAALKDPSVWQALRLMLDEPGQSHTVDSLAEAVGMSRSAFAKRFSDAYGSGPMELLRDLRMRMAGTLLKESDLPVKRIAEMVGFSSRSAFSRMFETKVGQSPRKFRDSELEANKSQSKS